MPIQRVFQLFTGCRIVNSRWRIEIEAIESGWAGVHRLETAHQSTSRNHRSSDRENRPLFHEAKDRAVLQDTQICLQAGKLKLRIAECMINLIAIFCILGWWIFWLTMLSGARPSESPGCALAAGEIAMIDRLATRAIDESTAALKRSRNDNISERRYSRMIRM